MAVSGGPTAYLVDPSTGQAVPPVAPGTPVVTEVHRSGIGTVGQILTRVLDVFTYGAGSAALHYAAEGHEAPATYVTRTGSVSPAQQQPAQAPVRAAAGQTVVPSSLYEPLYYAPTANLEGIAMNGDWGGWWDMGDAASWSDVGDIGADWGGGTAVFDIGAPQSGMQLPPPPPTWSPTWSGPAVGGFGYGEAGGLPGGTLPGAAEGGWLGQLAVLAGKALGMGSPLGAAKVLAPMVGMVTGIPGLGAAAAPGGGATMAGFGIGSMVPAITTAVGRITATRAWALVRRNGLGAVATALGIGAAELASWLMANPPRRRRRRGISSRDVRTTKRVVGFVCRINDQLRSIKARKVC